MTQMLLACSGWECSRLISVSDIPGGNPVTLRDPEGFALAFRICADCHQNFCDRCAPSGSLFASARCIHCHGKLVDGRRLAKVEATKVAPVVELRDRSYDIAVKGHIEEALRGFDEAVRQRPAYVQAHFDRGIALNLLGRRTDALASFERAIELHPAHVEAMYCVGGIHRANKDFDAALAAYERALELQPRHLDAMVNKVSTLNDLGRQPEAIAIADEVLHIAHPEDSETRAIAFGVRGPALLGLARYAEALEALDAAIAEGLDDRLVHTNRATALEKLGRTAEATAARRTAEQRPVSP